MSGGAFDFVYSRIFNFAFDLETALDNQGGKNDDLEYYVLEPEVEKNLRKTVELAYLVSKLAKEAEWFYSGDNGAESYLENIKEIMDVKEIMEKYSIIW